MEYRYPLLMTSVAYFDQPHGILIVIFMLTWICLKLDQRTDKGERMT
jgi:hypothetical protein